MAAKTVTAAHLTRRQFLGGTAGLTFAVGVGTQGTWLVANAASVSDTLDIGAWVSIGTDNRIQIITPAAEMGQGSMTGVPVALAEELDADWAQVDLKMAPAEPEIYGYERGRGRSMGIFGSLAVRSYFEQMRLAGAQVRKVLINAAATEWGVDPVTLETGPSRVIDPVNRRSFTYGEIAGFASAPESMPAVSKNDLKDPRDFRIIGNSVARRDIPEKVDGSAQYSIDVQLPGMVYATVLHAPIQMSRPKTWNDEAVRALPGVIDIVGLEFGVAVVADTFEHALAGRGGLQVEWDSSAAAEGYDSESMLESGYMNIMQDPDSEARVVNSSGVGAKVFDAAAKVYKADYRADYAYHAQMEPLNAVARFNKAGDEVEIWEGTQAPGRSRAQIAAALGMDVSQVVHHQQYLGGGFGRRSVSDYSIEAALVARATRLPVKLLWTREEDIGNGMFRPQNLQCVEAALDADGAVTGWRHCVVGDGGGLIYSGINIDDYYGVPNQQIETRGASHGIRLKHWRAVAHPFNLFAIESLVDEMAVDAGVDPFTFRRERLSMKPKARAVFDAVERMSDWHAPRPDGRALGLSVSERSGSLGAGVVEISLNHDTGAIRVHRVWIAVDGGTVVQPDMARANVESGVIYGLSSVLTERVSVKGGAVQQSNFNDYQVMRMADAPEEIHVEFLKRDSKPTGLGEIGNPFVSAAVANAFFALTGQRLYHMPFTRKRVRDALATA